MAARDRHAVAGNICNTNVFSPDERAARAVRAMFDEQVGWMVEAGVDLVVGETFSWGEEALIALDVDPASRAAVGDHARRSTRRPGRARAGRPEEACRRLADAGADVVGLNCIRGPKTMLPLLGAIRAAVDCHVAALPVPYRTTRGRAELPVADRPGAMRLPGGRPFPTALDPFCCNRYEIAEFAPRRLRARASATSASAAAPRRTTSAAWPRRSAARRRRAAISPDMTKHAFLGTDAKLKDHNLAYAKEL